MHIVSKHILIIPQGWTEFNYASSLKRNLPRDKQRSISIEIPKPNNENQPLKLLEKAIRKIKDANRYKNPYEVVWIILDNDNNPDIKKFFKLLTNSKVKLQIAYSSICIEHWFILHLENCRTPFENAEKACKKLNTLWQKFFDNEYNKKDFDHYEKLKKYQCVAINRATQIEEDPINTGISIEERNPYFTIHKLIKFFEIL